MDISNQNLNTTEITIRNNSKTDAENSWKDDNDDYQAHATIFSTDSTTESDETTSMRKRVNIMDLEKRKEAYGVCGECNEPEVVLVKFIWLTGPKEIFNDFLNEIKYYISGGLSEPVNSTDYLSSYQETISSSSANPISECLDCELNELDLNQDDDE
ncbi:unnamed protein product [Rhizophagus irregularis]|uniref:Uncharacterized protein n=1 Tax=Rhizophagus irregularis TaxID=588596 RepID=A0A916EI05_9GLOM|nr:unnamed protein product [Rhizophagus irregularis]CAB5384269.1 unnamed protein product [Rhizophagus irregularis]